MFLLLSGSRISWSEFSEVETFERMVQEEGHFLPSSQGRALGGESNGEIPVA
jgi:hypothetical protein